MPIFSSIGVMDKGNALAKVERRKVVAAMAEAECSVKVSTR